ncbi:MAG: acetyl-CoA acetyltransferase [Sulfitobacter sp.]
MADQTHPFHEIAAIAAKRGMDLKIKVENGGDYVRLYQDTPPVFFKYRDDPSDPFDRQNFDSSKRILLSQEDCADVDFALDLIQRMLTQFADYTPRRT